MLKLLFKQIYVYEFPGTNVEKGKAILFESKLPISFATDLDQAAEKVIASMQ